MTNDEARAVLAQIRAMLDTPDDSPEGSMGEQWIVRQIKEVIAQADPPPVDTPRQRMMDAEAVTDARQSRADANADTRALAVMAATIFAATDTLTMDESLERAAYMLRRAREVPRD